MQVKISFHQGNFSYGWQFALKAYLIFMSSSKSNLFFTQNNFLLYFALVKSRNEMEINLRK